MDRQTLPTKIIDYSQRPETMHSAPCNVRSAGLLSSILPASSGPQERGEASSIPVGFQKRTDFQYALLSTPAGHFFCAFAFLPPPAHPVSATPVSVRNLAVYCRHQHHDQYRSVYRKPDSKLQGQPLRAFKKTQCYRCIM